MDAPPHPRLRGLLLKFLLFLTPVFFVLALPGIGFLVHQNLDKDNDLLAARFGNMAARAAAAIERHDAIRQPRLALDLLGPLASDRAFVCAELHRGDGTVAVALPPHQGCPGKTDSVVLDLPVGEDTGEFLRVRFDDSELQEANRKQIILAVSIVGLAFFFALLSAALGFRRIVARPLRQLRNAISRSAETGKRRPVGVSSNDELGDVIAAFDEMIARENRREVALTQANRELQISEAKLKELNDELEQRIQERTADLMAEKQRAEAASRAKSEFLAAVSHELRTPLNAIIGFSEVMKQKGPALVDSKKHRSYATDINDSGKHLLALINDILDLSKIEAGIEEIQEDFCDVSEVVESVLKLVRQRAEYGGLSLTADVPEDLPGLHADKRKLKQILVNLLSNAIKFTNPAGSVALRVSLPAAGGVDFAVTDTGIGIAAGDIPKAFSHFGQVDAALSRKYEGVGLGLPLSRAMAELHGGSLELQSKPGVGTTTILHLPQERLVESGKTAAE